MVNFIIKSKPDVLNETLMLGPILFQNKANSFSKEVSQSNLVQEIDHRQYIKLALP